MMNNKFKIDKGSKIVLFILIAYVVIIICIFLPIYLKNRREKIYIISDEFKIKYENGKWNRITNPDDYETENFHIYEDGNYRGEYQVIYSNKFHLYENGRNVKYTGILFGHRGTLDLSYLNAETIETIQDTDKEVITKVFNENNLPINFNFNLYQKMNYNLNDEGTMDSIYCISNYYMDGMDKYYSIIFTYIDGEINIVDKIITDSDGTYEEPMFKLSNLVDIRNDNKYELLYMNNYFSQSGTDCVKLYNVSKEKEIHNFCE